MKFIFLFLCVLLVEISDSCPPSLSSLNLPPPVIHMECLRKQNPCRAGYICRRYRCIATSRALSSKLLDLETSKMEKCCSRELLPRRCMGFCTIGSYNESSVFRLLSEPNRCPISALKTIHFCASEDKDHVSCCQKKFISSDCLDLCAPSHPDTVFDESKLHCLQYITIMKSCFESPIN